MVVQHNLQAINSNRLLGITQGTLSGSTEKLSSGYKINRAADNAAGLTISEKMRKQIRGLTQASTNAEDGVSAVQTAEGALTEVHDMLQRMNELAVQASNGTNSESDRQAIQDEISQLTTEIDRVAETTKFNEIYLLKGNAEGTKSENLVAAHDAGLDGKLVDNGDGTYSFKLEEALKAGDSVKIGGQEYEIGESKDKLDYVSISTVTGWGEKGTGKIYENAIDLTSATVASETGKTAALKLRDGDSITKSNGEKITFVEKLTAEDIIKHLGDDSTATTNDSWANNDSITIKSASGVISTYTISDTVATDLEKGIIAQADVEKELANLLKAGTTIVDINNAKINAGNNGAFNNIIGMKIEELEEGEVNIFATKTASQKELREYAIGQYYSEAEVGDKIVLGGKEQQIVAGTPSTFDDLKSALEKLGEGAWVVVGEDTLTGKPNVYQIATGQGDAPVENTVDGYQKLTVDQILARIKDGDTVRTYSKNNTAGLKDELTNSGVGSTIASTTSDGRLDAMLTAEMLKKAEKVYTALDGNKKNITEKEAYDMMTEELGKASSIGTDTAAEVEHLGDGDFRIKQGSVTYTDALNFSLHVGADADMTNKIMVNIESMSTAGLGIKNLNVKDETGAAATYAIDAIADAVAKVSAQRSALGAVQNRLDHTIKNLDNVVENTTAAESRIRDTDMATEMVQYSNANILAQAGQSMLAQANQSNQGVLSLLG